MLDLHVQPDIRTQYATAFRPTGTLLADEMLQVVAARAEEALKLLDMPYQTEVSSDRIGARMVSSAAAAEAHVKAQKTKA